MLALSGDRTRDTTRIVSSPQWPIPLGHPYNLFLVPFGLLKCNLYLFRGLIYEIHSRNDFSIFRHSKHIILISFAYTSYHNTKAFQFSLRSGISRVPSYIGVPLCHVRIDLLYRQRTCLLRVFSLAFMNKYNNYCFTCGW